MFKCAPTGFNVVSLFDYTGNMVRPWAEAGHHCTIVDVQHKREGMIECFESGGSIMAVRIDLSNGKDLRDLADWKKPGIIFSFPPCTDLAVSGACRFAAKREANPDFQQEAAELARTAQRLAAVMKMNTGQDVPWFAENPVSVLSTLWRKPDYRFDPCDFGGWIPEDEAVHPDYPEVIPPRDAYTKRTCLWTGGGLRLPEKRRVEPVFLSSGLTPLQKLGGRSQRTKNIRSATPRGFALAMHAANRDLPVRERT